MSVEAEIWKDVQGYEGRYQVSNLGRVKSFQIDINGRLLARRFYKNGYERVNLGGKDYLLHRIIAHSFIPNFDSYLEIDHIDGNKSNNRIDNLRWVTRSENRRNPNTQRFGKEHHLSKQVIQMNLCGEVLAIFGSVRDAVRVGGFGFKGVQSCCSGKGRKKNITEYYKAKTHKGFMFKYG